jgi:hypothetical protein
MAKREDIETAIWSDPDFLALSGPARAVYVWSFTNQRAGMSGIYKVAAEQVALETGFKGRALEGALAELQGARFLFYDGRVMFVRTKTKRARNRSETIAKSIKSDVLALDDHPFVGLWWQENENQGWVTKLMDAPVNTGDSVGSNMGPRCPTGGAHVYGNVPVYVNEGGVGGDGVEPSLPADFPDDLTPHLTAVQSVLGDLAARHGASAVTRLSLASVIAGRPRKPLVKSARDFASWADGKAQKRRDVVAGYRNWLDRTDDLAATERFGVDVSAPSTGDSYEQRRAMRTAAAERLLAERSAQ